MLLSKISDIFEVKYGVNLELSNIEEIVDGIPFVSRTEKNNGVSSRVKIITGVNPNPKHTISVAGGGSVLSSFYQKEEYYSGRDLYYLKPKIELSKNEMLYYCMCIKANKYKYSYGRQANKTLASLIVPSVKSIPNWVNAMTFPSININSISDNIVTMNLKNWKYFKLSDIFNITKGKYKGEREKGFVNLVSATSTNNGVLTKVARMSNVVNICNVITVSSNGDVGDAFYQVDGFIATGDVNILTPKFNLNKYSAIFLITIIQHEKFRFNYGRKWGKIKMIEHQIKLPVDEEDNPDWQFMENYIKSLPYSTNL